MNRRTAPLNAAVVILAVLLGGCQRPLQDLTPHREHAPATPIPESPDLPPGGIEGRVTWTDPIPTVPPIRGLIGAGDGARWGEAANPHAPQIDPRTKGIVNAVVFLKTVTAERVKPWPYPTVAVEQADLKVRVRQGGRVGAVGFARVGDDVEMVSRDDAHHMLRARGAAQFTLAFPQPNRPLKRIFATPGRVEFTSAVGYFWSAANVFVCQHPYYTTTDSAGRYRLENVPDGEYGVAVWLPNWNVLGRDRDPEAGRIVRVEFAEPFTAARQAVVAGGKLVEADFTLPHAR